MSNKPQFCKPASAPASLELRMSIKEAISGLCSSTGAYYAHIFNALEQVYTRAVHTFAIGPMGHRYVLYINPDAEKMSPAEIMASMEHEVLHVVLNHIPRGRRMRATLETPRDKFLFALFDNLAADAAVNEKLRRNHVGVDDPAQPLGYWVIAEKLVPPQARDLSYEAYLTSLMNQGDALLKDPQHLYTLALRILRKELLQIQEAAAVHTAAIAEKDAESRAAADALRTAAAAAAEAEEAGVELTQSLG